MNRRDWREPLPSSKAEAAALLGRRIPFNAVRLAELADKAYPLGLHAAGPLPAQPVDSVLPGAQRDALRREGIG